VVRLIQKRTINIESPNPYAAINTCTTTEYSIPGAADVPQLLLGLSSEVINTLCKSYWSDQNKSECAPEQCFWHQKGKKSKKPQEEKEKSTFPPEQNAGSEHRKRSLSSESTGNQPLNHGTSRDSDRTNRLINKQNNQKTRTNAEGKLLKKPNPETRHSFQRRFCL